MSRAFNYLNTFSVDEGRLEHTIYCPLISFLGFFCWYCVVGTGGKVSIAKRKCENTLNIFLKSRL